MPKYKITIEYDGTNFHGWQLQNGVITVQEVVEKALEHILKTASRVYAAGRTDAGVHAKGQVAHFYANWRHSSENLQNAMNAVLPSEICIKNISQIEDDFHARHSALSKTYIYQILNKRLRSALHRLYSWHVPQPLNISNIQQATDHLLGSHDFAAFGQPTDGTPSTVREILLAKWAEDPASEMLTFTICGTGFLRYMVRSIVGTLVLVGSGKIDVKQFRSILESRDRTRAGPTAPPQGLFLHCVSYDPNERHPTGV